MKNEIKVSIILPSLNVVNYIEECMESVVNQTLREIEIICVDAYSTDGTLEILYAYEIRDKRVKVFLSDKKSYGYQMNIGMEVASGEYIAIVETDDYVQQKMYEDLYNIAIENEVDFIKSDFYRFSGNAESRSKAIYPLSKKLSYYNRVINVSKEQECFRFPMNTWSGIYRKQYINKNHIFHNETPGASFQDNGFWFQTFIYARRAFFVNKPYYMNRRDNPFSSVFSQNKSYCIFDEYEFIWNILKKNESIFKAFIKTYTYCCYQAYKGHYERIGAEYREEFLRKCMKFYRKLNENNGFIPELYREEEWKQIRLIMQNSKDYYENEQQNKNDIYKEISKFEKVVIFGAGMVGKRIYNDLLLLKIPVEVVAFAVSSSAENIDFYHDISIMNITSLLQYKESAIIVIATTEVHHKKIKTTLDGLGFAHILQIPEM